MRLTNHLNYFLETMKKERTGRKLGFITQEIGREINTLGSKSNQADMQKIVVEMKDNLEKMKEQVPYAESHKDYPLKPKTEMMEAIPEEKIVVAETEVEVVDTIEDPAEEAELTNTPEEQNMSEVEGALEKPEFSIGGLAAAPKSNVMATGGAYTKGAGESFESVGDMAQELIAQYKHGGGDRGWRNIAASGVRDEVKFASASFDDSAENSYMLSTVNEGANYNTMNEAIADYKSASADDTLVASGGICAPFQQDYSFFRLAKPQAPLEGSFPRVGAPRGGIKFILPPDFTDARAAITTVTCAEDALGYVSTPDDCLPGARDTDEDPATGTNYGTTPDKPCACVSCPDVAECCVTAVPWCVRWGNFNYYTFPELVENFMSDLMVAYAAEKEVFYLDALAANSTVVTAADVYGASRSVLDTIARASVNYRKRHSMDRGSKLNLFAPDWLLDVMKADLALAHGRDALFVSDAEIISHLKNLNVNVTLYYHTPSTLPNGVPSQAFDGAQGTGALASWPAQAVTFLHAPGTFVRLDGGSLDFGLVRDSSLIATNDFIVAAEQFTGLCMVGLESLMIVHDICVNGSGAGPTDAITCA